MQREREPYKESCSKSGFEHVDCKVIEPWGTFDDSKAIHVSRLDETEGRTTSGAPLTLAEIHENIIYKQFSDLKRAQKKWIENSKSLTGAPREEDSQKEWIRQLSSSSLDKPPSTSQSRRKYEARKVISLEKPATADSNFLTDERPIWIGAASTSAPKCSAKKTILSPVTSTFGFCEVPSLKMSPSPVTATPVEPSSKPDKEFVTEDGKIVKVLKIDQKCQTMRSAIERSPLKSKISERLHKSPQRKPPKESPERAITKEKGNPVELQKNSKDVKSTKVVRKDSPSKENLKNTTLIAKIETENKKGADPCNQSVLEQRTGNERKSISPPPTKKDYLDKATPKSRASLPCKLSPKDSGSVEDKTPPKPRRSYDVHMTRSFIKQKKKERDDKLAEEKKRKIIENEEKRKKVMQVRETQRKIMQNLKQKSDRDKPRWIGPLEVNVRSPKALKDIKSPPIRKPRGAGTLATGVISFMKNSRRFEDKPPACRKLFMNYAKSKSGKYPKIRDHSGDSNRLPHGYYHSCSEEKENARRDDGISYFEDGVNDKLDQFQSETEFDTNKTPELLAPVLVDSSTQINILFEDRPHINMKQLGEPKQNPGITNKKRLQSFFVSTSDDTVDQRKKGEKRLKLSLNKDSRQGLSVPLSTFLGAGHWRSDEEPDECSKPKTPDWLTDLALTPDPFNLINTFKMKLQTLNRQDAQISDVSSKIQTFPKNEHLPNELSFDTCSGSITTRSSSNHTKFAPFAPDTEILETKSSQINFGPKKQLHLAKPPLTLPKHRTDDDLLRLSAERVDNWNLQNLSKKVEPFSSPDNANSVFVKNRQSSNRRGGSTYSSLLSDTSVSESLSLDPLQLPTEVGHLKLPAQTKQSKHQNLNDLPLVPPDAKLSKSPMRSVSPTKSVPSFHTMSDKDKLTCNAALNQNLPQGLEANNQSLSYPQKQTSLVPCSSCSYFPQMVNEASPADVCITTGKEENILADTAGGSMAIKVSSTLSTSSSTTVISTEFSQVHSTSAQLLEKPGSALSEIMDVASLKSSINNLQNSIGNIIKSPQRSIQNFESDNTTLASNTPTNSPSSFGHADLTSSPSGTYLSKHSEQMFKDILKDELLKSEQQSTALKIKEKSLIDNTTAEIDRLEGERRKLLESGKEEEARIVKKKVRALIMNLCRELKEIQRLRKLEKTASKERRSQLLQPTSSKTKLINESSKEIEIINKYDDKLKKLSSNSFLTVALRSVENSSQDILDVKARELKAKEQFLRERRRNVEAIVAWKKRLEQEEKKVQEMERVISETSVLSALTNRQKIQLDSTPCFALDDNAQKNTKSWPPVEFPSTTNQDIKCRDSDQQIKEKEYYSDTFESSVISETSITNSITKISHQINDLPSRRKSLPLLKYPLSPRFTILKRRYSSGSDESITFSQNETSEQSDTELRVSVLQQQLKQRKAELERLQRDYHKSQRERLRAKEQSLINQIHAYDNYIEHVKMELQKELEREPKPVVKPQIKQQKFSERKKCDSCSESVKEKPGDIITDTSTNAIAEANLGRKITNERETNTASEKTENAFISTQTFYELPDGKEFSEDSPLDSVAEEISKKKIVTSNSEPPTVSEVEGIVSAKESESPRRESNFSGTNTTFSITEEVSPTSVGKSIQSHTTNKLLKSAEITCEYSQEASISEEIYTEMNYVKSPASSPNNSLLKSSQTEKSTLKDNKSKSKTISKTINDVERLDSKASPDCTLKFSESFNNYDEISECLAQTKKDDTSIESLPEVSEDIHCSEQDSTRPETSSHTGKFKYVTKRQVDRDGGVSPILIENLRDTISDINSSLKSEERHYEKFIENLKESISEYFQESSGTPETLDKQVSSIGKIEFAAVPWSNENSEIITDRNSNDMPSSSTAIPENTSEVHKDEDAFSENSNKNNSFFKLPPEIELSTLTAKLSQACEDIEKSGILSTHSENFQKTTEFSSNETSLQSPYLDGTTHTSKAEESHLKTSSDEIEYEVKEKIVSNKEVSTKSELVDQDETILEECQTASANSSFDGGEDVGQSELEDISKNGQCSTHECLRSPISDIDLHSSNENAILQILQDSYGISDKILKENLDQFKKSTEGTPLLTALQREKQHSINVDDLAKQICNNYIDEATEAIVNAYMKKKKAVLNEKGNGMLFDQVTCGKVGDNEGFWLGEGLNLQTAREAEQLRLQQLQIEQEIEELEQAQEVLPYYYVRAIPNKPPPPYTPPRQSPPTREEILARIRQGGEILWEIDENGGDLLSTTLPSTYLSNIQDNSYREFMFDLCKELYLKLKPRPVESQPPWLTVVNGPRKPLPPIKCKEDLLSYIEKEAKFVFGFEQKIMRENMIMRWTRKKRDQVDEILIRELQEEEAEWTNFAAEENIIKNQVADSLIDQMLDEAVEGLSKALAKKFPEAGVNS